jgi:predicted DCC family thiol-disulfide oxidoreductase YuxK
MTAAPILLYDGDCAFCARSVRFLLDHDTRRRDARFAAKTSAAGHAVLGRHPEMAAVDSLVWVESTASAGEVALVRSDALLAIARYLGGGWSALGAMSRVIPRVPRHRGQPPPPLVRRAGLRRLLGCRAGASPRRAGGERPRSAC